MSYYKGRVALVTGASSGIGAAVAETLVKEGLIVVGVARREDKIKALAKTLQKESGRLIAKKLDVLKDEEIVELYKWAEKELGGFDVIVNNAGVFYPTPFHELTTEQMKSTLDTNLLSVAVSSREAINSMLRRNVKDGFIVNINSVSGLAVSQRRGVGHGLYPASKFGLTALCKTLRFTIDELGLQTRVTSINPGVVKTGLSENLLDALSAKGHVIKYMDVDVISKSVAFVLSMPPAVEIPDLTIIPQGIPH